MGGRPPDKFVLKRKDKAFLLEVLRDGQTPLKVARRAQILLGRANGEQSIVALEEKVEQDRTTIWRVCERYEDGGLDAALYDAPRSGRPRVFSPAPASEDRVAGMPIARECRSGRNALVASELGAGRGTLCRSDRSAHRGRHLARG
jgi:hypothetical protein